MDARRPAVAIRSLTAVACAAFGALTLAVACAPKPAPVSATALDPEADPAQAACSCELRSWIVAGRGRHLLLDIDCPPPNGSLSGVVEFANTAMREDFDWTRDPRGMPRVARMTPGVRVRSLLPDPDERVEARWAISPGVAACLQRDRVFAFAYFLLGPNSNSAMRAVCEACGVELPDAVLSDGGALGAFPGVDRTPGAELPRADWPAIGGAPPMP